MRTKWIQYLNTRKQNTPVISNDEKQSLQHWVKETKMTKCQLDEIITYHRNAEWNEIKHSTLTP